MPIAKTSPARAEHYAPVKGIDGTANLKSIRFQVVIWHIGTIDVQTGFVKVRFRLTLFWTDDAKKDVTSPSKANKNIQPDTVWEMAGRQRAHLKTWDKQESMVKEMIDVPPVSILNAVEFETVDAPEITMTNTQTRSMRWTCMYSATLFQVRPRTGISLLVCKALLNCLLFYHRGITCQSKTFHMTNIKSN